LLSCLFKLLTCSDQQLFSDVPQHLQFIVRDVGALIFLEPEEPSVTLVVATSILASPRLPRPASRGFFISGLN